MCIQCLFSQHTYSLCLIIPLQREMFCNKTDINKSCPLSFNITLGCWNRFPQFTLDQPLFSSFSDCKERKIWIIPLNKLSGLWGIDGGWGGGCTVRRVDFLVFFHSVCRRRHLTMHSHGCCVCRANLERADAPGAPAVPSSLCVSADRCGNWMRQKLLGHLLQHGPRNALSVAEMLREL